MKAEITPQHTWLHQLVGEWQFEGESVGADGQPTMKMSGTESVRKLGDAWVQCDGRSQVPDEMGGGLSLMQFTLGYDPAKGHFVGTFIGSMMTHLWIYHRGELDADGRTLALYAEGPAFDRPAGTMAQYRDSIQIVGPDERLLLSHLQGPDGQWIPFMTSRYRRTR
ncbi:MAG TPA: DUF1579 domain-containing protein [Burkholderiaceae bacterium]|nr:DUF1579 domain-containing protein [Burkholderiaceae bacterium]